MAKEKDNKLRNTAIAGGALGTLGLGGALAYKSPGARLRAQQALRNQPQLRQWMRQKGGTLEKLARWAGPEKVKLKNPPQRFKVRKVRETVRTPDGQTIQRSGLQRIPAAKGKGSFKSNVKPANAGLRRASTNTALPMRPKPRPETRIPSDVAARAVGNEGRRGVTESWNARRAPQADFKVEARGNSRRDKAAIAIAQAEEKAKRAVRTKKSRNRLDDMAKNAAVVQRFPEKYDDTPKRIARDREQRARNLRDQRARDRRPDPIRGSKDQLNRNQRNAAETKMSSYGTNLIEFTQPRTREGKFDSIRRAGADPKVMDAAYNGPLRRIMRRRRSIDGGVEQVTKTGYVGGDQLLAATIEHNRMARLNPGHPAIVQNAANLIEMSARVSPQERAWVNRRLIQFQDGPGRPRKYDDGPGSIAKGTLAGGAAGIGAGAAGGYGAGRILGRYGGLQGGDLSRYSRAGAMRVARAGGMVGAGIGMGAAGMAAIQRRKARRAHERQFSAGDGLVYFARPQLAQRLVNRAKGAARRFRSDITGQTRSRLYNGRPASPSRRYMVPGVTGRNARVQQANSALSKAKGAERRAVKRADEAERNVKKMRSDANKRTKSGNPFVYIDGLDGQRIASKAEGTARLLRTRAQEKAGITQSRQGAADRAGRQQARQYQAVRDAEGRQRRARRIAIGAGIGGLGTVGGGTAYIATRKKEMSARPRLIFLDADDYDISDKVGTPVALAANRAGMIEANRKRKRGGDDNGETFKNRAIGAAALGSGVGTVMIGTAALRGSRLPGRYASWIPHRKDAVRAGKWGWGKAKKAVQNSVAARADRAAALKANAWADPKAKIPRGKKPAKGVRTVRHMGALVPLNEFNWWTTPVRMGKLTHKATGKVVGRWKVPQGGTGAGGYDAVRKGSMGNLVHKDSGKTVAKWGVNYRGAPAGSQLRDYGAPRNRLPRFGMAASMAMSSRRPLYQFQTDEESKRDRRTLRNYGALGTLAGSGLGAYDSMLATLGRSRRAKTAAISAGALMGSVPGFATGVTIGGGLNAMRENERLRREHAKPRRREMSARGRLRYFKVDENRIDSRVRGVAIGSTMGLPGAAVGGAIGGLWGKNNKKRLSNRDKAILTGAGVGSLAMPLVGGPIGAGLGSVIYPEHTYPKKRQLSSRQRLRYFDFLGGPETRKHWDTNPLLGAAAINRRIGRKRELDRARRAQVGRQLLSSRHPIHYFEDYPAYGVKDVVRDAAIFTGIGMAPMGIAAAWRRAKRGNAAVDARVNTIGDAAASRWDQNRSARAQTQGAGGMTRNAASANDIQAREAYRQKAMTRARGAIQANAKRASRAKWAGRVGMVRKAFLRR